jgi:hypothetical protein
MIAPVMMGITSPTGSHLPTLEAAVRRLAPDSHVAEHGAGLYSTPLLARLGVRVTCAEPHVGWAEWARWIYRGNVDIVDSWKRLVPLLSDVALAFVDGAAKERGPLIAACLERGVSTIIAHDTQPEEWAAYGYQPHFFTYRGYDVSQHAEETHRTTLWIKRA